MTLPVYKNYLLALFCCSLQLIVQSSTGCPPEPQRHKKLSIGIYYPTSFYNEWKHESGKQDPGPSIQQLATDLNKWFTAKKLGNNNQITVRIESGNVNEITDEKVEELKVPRNLQKTSVKFCGFANQHKTESGQTWDVAFLFLPENEYNFGGIRGAAAGIGSACSTVYNCGALLSTSKHSKTFQIFPKLWAHENGHLFGLINEQDCLRHKFKNCTRPNGSTIMGSPGNSDADWSPYSKNIINQRFEDEKEFPCLEWECGRYSPNDMFSDPQLKVILDNMCSGLKDNYEIPPDRPTDLEIEQMRQNTNSQVSQFTADNPEYYKQENVCKGIPCQEKKTAAECANGCGRRITYFTQWHLENKECGKGMICSGGECI